MSGPRPILHLIDTGGPGGAETIYLDVARGLDPARWAGSVVLPERDWLWREAERSGLEPLLVPSVRSFDASYLARLVALAVRRRVALIQTHLFGSAVYGAMVARLLRIPLVSTFHGTVDIGREERWLKSKLRLLDRADHRIVFVSDALRTWFEGMATFHRARAQVIRNGIDLGRFRPGRDDALRRDLGVRPDQFLVGAVGNLRAAKAHDVLLRAAAALVRRVPDVRLVIVGEGGGELRERLLALRDELDLAHVVQFVDFREDVERVFRAIDAYVVSSHSEGFSLTTVQAMATGIPVVSTRCGGPEEILADGGGLLVAPSRPEELAAALERLFRDRSLAGGLGARGLEVARARFGRQRMVDGYGALYERCLDRQGDHER